MRTGWIGALAAAGALAACTKTDDAWHLTSRGASGAPIFSERDDEAGTAGRPVNAGVRARGASAGQESAGAEQPQATAQTHEVSGRVVTASDRELVVKRDDGVKPDLRLKIGPGATITLAGKTARAADLKAGTPVRAAYEAPPGGADTAPTAIRIVGQPEGTATGAPHGAGGGVGGEHRR